MCGVFGAFVPAKSISSNRNSTSAAPQAVPLNKVLRWLAIQSEIRGQDASGFTIYNLQSRQQPQIMKEPVAISKLISTAAARKIFAQLKNSSSQLSAAHIFLGHARLATHGSIHHTENNQPLRRGEIIGIHNGVILNADTLWEQITGFTRTSQNDSDALISLLSQNHIYAKDLKTAAQQTFASIRGTASAAFLIPQKNEALLATNHGSLFVWHEPNLELILFASDRLALEKTKQKFSLQGEIQQLAANTAEVISYDESTDQFQRERFSLPKSATHVKSSSPDLTIAHDIFKTKTLESDFEQARLSIQKITRCTQCVLPATIPFIDFDSRGVCNFCRSYQVLQPFGLSELEKKIAPYRRPNNQADSIIAFSGGRDSSFGLHFAVRELGLKPLAYTYEWGMVTDVARRNISRMCSELQIEHVIISADIKQKRKNIQKNIQAWLRRPHLGMVPLFMAGDKSFFWHSKSLQRQMGIELEIFSINLLENAPFKEDLTGIHCWDPAELSEKTGPELGWLRKTRLPLFYARQFLMNPKYWNRSLPDSLIGYLRYYFGAKTFVEPFRYLKWDENKINHTLKSEYGWEDRGEHRSTWRIGDGTTPFYNYIYYVMAGFTENDTLRSNQVREGQLTREQALKLTDRDNQAQWEDLQWYCDAVGIDCFETLNAINGFQKSYPTI